MRCAAVALALGLACSSESDRTTALTEAGAPVPRRGSSPNQHDIMTGSTSDAMAYPATPDRTYFYCFAAH